MFVKDWMSTNVVTLEVDDSMQRASGLMKEHGVRMLPVLKRGKVVGIVSDTDLKRASPSDATLLDIHELLFLLSSIKVKGIMCTSPVTIPPDFTVEEAAELFRDRKISGAPVVDGKGTLVGIITRDDLFNVLIALTGLGRKGVLFGFEVEDRPGSIQELTNRIRACGGRISSILSCDNARGTDLRVAYIRAYDIDRGQLPELLAAFKKEGVLLSVVDHRENRREIYREGGC